jgi:hypothetical protein
VTVQNSGGGGGGGGATYTGTNGNAYGVFTGGGYGSTTDVEACAWPVKPSNTDCGKRPPIIQTIHCLDTRRPPIISG